MTAPPCANAHDADAEDLMQHYSEVHSYLRRLTKDDALAEDLAQDSFVRAWKAVKNRGPPCSPRAWLYAIASNRVRTHTARLRNEAENLETYLRSSEGSEEGDRPLELLMGEEVAASVRKAVRDLEPLDRRLVQQYYLAGRKLKAVADELGLNYSAAKTRVHRARQQLTKMLLDVDHGGSLPE